MIVTRRGQTSILDSVRVERGCKNQRQTPTSRATRHRPLATSSLPRVRIYPASSTTTCGSEDDVAVC